ncbi:uncharacterized protein LOC109705460 isoform X1 [Ananas comosus]|uniref:Uncharacterized protein LOC109705460 isoform X1 n=2 Tax=Ananas comosus TaxID=4615 RepID=A0A6P5EES6_ANACO|nr:uncharacterized protein LOC109705460 isoform X1 [Ananas comosus]
MNFLLRPTQPVAPELPSFPEAGLPKDITRRPTTTLEGLIAEDPLPGTAAGEDGDNNGDVGVGTVGSTPKDQFHVGNHHTDVTDDEGWITIPYKKLPENWSTVPDILQLRSLDRSFIFPGEQIHILVCLSATKQDTETITPFRVAAVMSRNGKSQQNGKQQMESSPSNPNSISDEGEVNGTCEEAADHTKESNGETLSTAVEMPPKQDISMTESLLRMEDHRQQTENILERFKNSNFFVRIAQSDEPLWSKRSLADQSPLNQEIAGGKSRLNDGGHEKASKTGPFSAVVDKGSFDGIKSGGVARDTVRCYSLSNGDIVVILRVNVGVSDIKDPILEVLQFEKCIANDLVSENRNGMHVQSNEDPCRELLNWLLPLDRTLPPPRPLSPPLSSTISHKPSYSASGSQIFSFSHFRSYSMPSLPQSVVPPPSTTYSSNSKPPFDLEDFDRFSSEKSTKGSDMENEGLLSFRGVPLEPERYSVHCGLEGIYLPGRRWHRKVEIIQPLEIHSFAAGCTSEDLLCVQIKNVSPAHIPDIVIFFDAISIVCEDASKGRAPVTLPIASIEAGNCHSLPSLALRRGEEHSFILKPATRMCGENRSNGEATPTHPLSKLGTAASNMHVALRVSEHKKVSPAADQYAVLVSCRCNYTESKLFFKQATNWRPCVARDLMISVSSEPYKQTVGPTARVPQLPVQVLTLEATNLTAEDLTLTVLAPESSTSYSSVLSLNSTPTNPVNSYDGLNEYMGRTGGDKRAARIQRLRSIPADSRKEVDGGDNESSNAEGCTHLWLQSAVPLGCVPARSSATVKLELLPLTDGIITLDTLKIAIKEKGLTYIPEHSLKIYATSGISTGIL